MKKILLTIAVAGAIALITTFTFICNDIAAQHSGGAWQGTGSGDALVANPLSQFAATTSLQLLGVISDETGTGASVFATTPTLVTPVLGVASSTSLATSAATPLLLTNGQLVNIALTSQTVGATTLTIPDFASVVDEFTFKTKSQTMSNKIFVAPALGTPASGVATNLTGTAAGLTAGAVSTITGLAPDTATTAAAQPNITSLGAQAADLDLNGNNVDNGGVVFLIEQADADADVAGSGQIWVNTATPNELWFTDDAGTDVQLGQSGTGAFSDAGDPIVQNTTTKDVHVGDGAGTLAGKLEVGGDADQPQAIIEGFSTQTDDILIVQNDADTELFSISPSPSIKLLEVADAPGDTAGYGQIWVNLATPNELWFTDDAGTDVQLGAGGGGLNTALSNADAGLEISLSNNDSGASNTIFGNGAGDAILATGDDNTYIGHNAGTDHTTGDSNVGIGSAVMANTTTGSNNVAIGQGALDANVTDSFNVAIGQNALGAANGSDSCVAIGRNAGDGLNTADDNVCIGDQSLSAAAGEKNTAIGWNALRVSTAANLTAIGSSAGVANTSGTLNTFIGFQAGNVVTTGGSNTILGYDCDASANTGAGQIVIGDSLAGTADSRVHIGDGTSHIYADYNSANTWTHSSDQRQKRNIVNDTLGLDFINDLRTVRFQLKAPSQYPASWNSHSAETELRARIATETDPDNLTRLQARLTSMMNFKNTAPNKVIHGMIAQEVRAALMNAGVSARGFAGWDVLPDGRQAISPAAFVYPLIRGLQEVSARCDSLEARILALETAP